MTYSLLHQAMPRSSIVHMHDILLILRLCMIAAYEHSLLQSLLRHVALSVHAAQSWATIRPALGNYLFAQLCATSRPAQFTPMYAP